MSEVDDPVTYRVDIMHWQDGDIDVRVFGVGSSTYDRKAVAVAIRKAADAVESGEPLSLGMFS